MKKNGLSIRSRRVLVLVATAAALLVAPRDTGCTSGVGVVVVVEALSVPRPKTAPRTARVPTKLQAAASEAVEGGDGAGTATIPNEVL